MPKKNDNKKITVGENEFVLQHPGNRWCLDHDYKCRDANGNLITTDFVDGLLDHVVIKPQDFGIEDFDGLDELREFQEKVRKFL